MNRILKWLFPTVSYAWCVVGYGSGGVVRMEKCKNGVPVRSGYLLWMIKCPDRQTAEAVLQEIEDASRREATE